jgi:hypothetical protein
VRGRCLLCREEECAGHILLKYPELQRWADKYLNSKWLIIIEEVECKAVVSCTKIAGLRSF